MARSGSTNTVPATGGAAIYAAKEAGKAAGWTVPRSSDGTTYNSSGDQITSGSSGAGGMSNNSAWFVMREPGGRREWCFQRGTGGTLWRIKYSPSARFTGGSPGATQVPSATDEQVIIGGGTDAAPTFPATLPADGTYRLHAIFDSVPEGNAYLMHIWTTTTPAGAVTSAIIQEPMLSGSYPSEDTDPVVVKIVNALWGTNTAFSAYFAYGLGGQVWSTSCASNTFGTFPGSGATNPASGKEDGAKVPITGASVLKGLTKYLHFKNVNRAYPNTINQATDCYVYAGNWLMPYVNGVTPLL